MNKIKILLTIAAILFVSITLPLQANAEQPTTEESMPIEPKDILEEELLLLLPVETDNPNLTLVFADPSGEGVQLKIDSLEYTAIESPYILPSLAIGSHKLIFKFTDSEEVEQEVEKTLIIVPRAPVINPPGDIQDNKLLLNGTSLSLSNVKIFLTGATKSFTAETETNTSGEWEYVFEEDFNPGVYTIVAFAKRNGYASTYSEPIVFSLDEGEENAGTVTTVDNGVSFSFGDLSRGNIITVLQQNPHLGFLAVGSFIIGLLTSTILGFITGFIGERRFERSFRKQLNKAEKSTGDKKEAPAKKGSENKKVSLRGKFEAAGFKADSYVKESEGESSETTKSDRESPKSTEEANSEASKKEMSKEEFLSKFKDHDPDSDEKPESPKAIKKKSKKQKTESPATEANSEASKSEPKEADDSEESIIEEEISEAKKNEANEEKVTSSKIKFNLTSEDNAEGETLNKNGEDQPAREAHDKTDKENKDKKKPGNKKSQLEKSIKITLTSDSLGE